MERRGGRERGRKKGGERHCPISQNPLKYALILAIIFVIRTVHVKTEKKR